jgi:hypothetical protein
MMYFRWVENKDVISGEAAHVFMNRKIDMRENAVSG